MSADGGAARIEIVLEARPFSEEALDAVPGLRSLAREEAGALGLLLRSLIAPLYLMATIAFTYFATLGLVVVVFIVLVGHTGMGPGVPFYLFVFLNALSVDYNIYLMSRIREEARRTPLREATRHALARTGPVITSAGIILAGTFSALMTLSLQDLLQLGFGVAAGVLMDTFITRTLIVPSLVSLLGRWNWWPSRLKPSP